MALPIFEAAFGPRGSQPARCRPTAASRTARSSRSCSRDRRARSRTRWRATSIVSVPRWSATRLPACDAARLQRAGRVSDQLLPGQPVRGRQRRRACSPTRPRSEYDSLQLQFRQRYHNGLSLTANYTYGKARTDRYADSASTARRTTRTLRDKSLNWGPTAYDLRHVFQTLLDLRAAVRPRPRRSRSTTRCSTTSLGGWAAVGHRADPDGPSVPADERTPDPEPARRRRRPERHHRQGAAGHGDRPAGTERQRLLLRRVADRRRRPRRTRSSSRRRRRRASWASSSISMARACGTSTSDSRSSSTSPPIDA